MQYNGACVGSCHLGLAILSADVGYKCEGSSFCCYVFTTSGCGFGCLLSLWFLRNGFTCEGRRRENVTTEWKTGNEV